MAPLVQNHRNWLSFGGFLQRGLKLFLQLNLVAPKIVENFIEIMKKRKNKRI